MDPVRIGPKLDVIDMKAEGIIPYGAAVVRGSAAGTVVADKTANNHDVLGIANMSEVGRDVSGFYGTNDPVPVIVSKNGRINIWIIANVRDDDIHAGEFLEIADLGSSPDGTHGVWEEAANTAGGTYQVNARAQAMEDVTMGSDSYQHPAAVSVGDETITFALAATLTSLDVSSGSYILLEDVDGDLQVNQVKSINTAGTKIRLEKPSTVALEASPDYVHRMFQCEAILL